MRILLALLLALLSGSPVSAGCSCQFDDVTVAEFISGKSVFIGEAQPSNDAQRTPFEVLEIFHDGTGDITLSEHVWVSHMDVRDPSRCGLRFDVSEQVLLVAERTNLEQFRTRSCDLGILHPELMDFRNRTQIELPLATAQLCIGPTAAEVFDEQDRDILAICDSLPEDMRENLRLSVAEWIATR